MSDATEQLLAAQDGDARAFDRFFVLTQPDVTRFCSYLSGNEDVDDIVQDIYLRALRSLRTFRQDGPALRWLLGIARRVCADTIQRRPRKRQPVLYRPSPVQPDHANEVELRALLRMLEPDQRHAFVLTQVLQLSYDEAAALCDCPVGTIRSRVARARQHLTELIDRQRA